MQRKRRGEEPDAPDVHFFSPIKNRKQTLDFGIKIATGDAPFTLTTVITIVPRYILINKLPYSIKVSQYNYLQNIVLQPDERYCYCFKNALIPVDKKLVIGDAAVQPAAAAAGQSVPVSKPFYAEDLADFQLPYKSSVSRPLRADEMPDWHDPTEGNHFTRTVRVSVTSQDDATLFMLFQTPKQPEYTIKNATLDYVTVLIKGTTT